MIIPNIVYLYMSYTVDRILLKIVVFLDTIYLQVKR